MHEISDIKTIFNEYQSLEYVYFCYNPMTDLTKIGISQNIRNRINSISTGCGCRVSCVLALGYIPNGLRMNGKEAEVQIHSYFTRTRKVGEWFKLHDRNVNSFYNGLFRYDLFRKRELPVIVYENISAYDNHILETII